MIRTIAALLVLFPLVAGAQTPESILPKTPATSKEVITEKFLEAPKLDAIGITDPEGVLGKNIWVGSKSEEVLAWFARQNLTAPSVAAHRLITRLLSAPAALDNGEEGMWLKYRLQMLLKIGEEKALKDLLALIPLENRGDFVDRLMAEQELLKLNSTRACEIIAQDLAKYNDVFWLRANTYCLIKNKRLAEAELALQVLHEQKTDETLALPFEEAIHRMAGESIKIAPLKTLNLSPLELAIAVETGITFDTQIDKESNNITPVAARFLALNSKLPLITRTQLAERVFRIGILPREQLIELYKAASFKAELFAKAAKGQFPENPVEAHALAFQLSEKTPTLIPNLRKQFPADMAERLFSSGADWKTFAADKDIRVAALHKAFGLPMDEAAWKNFAGQKEMAIGANIAALDILKNAVDAKRVGEAALMSLSLMQYHNNSITLAALIDALRTIGLEKDANALAGEALFSDE